MSTLSFTFTPQEVILVREFLLYSLTRLEATATDAASPEHEVKRARFHQDCIRLFLQTDVCNPAALPNMIRKPVLHHVVKGLEERGASMAALTTDTSLTQENQLHVATHAVDLLPLMHKLTYDALHSINMQDAR